MTYTLHHGDCLNILPTIPAQSVDAIIADPPYGTTACKWDSVIPLAPMWAELKRVIKPRGAIVLFGAQPFTSELITSNRGWFKYCWTWDKNRGNGHLIARFRPLQQTEDIAVFCNGATTYNPVMVPRDKPRKFGKSPSQSEITNKQGFREDYTRPDYEHRFPTNLLHFSWANRDGLHPTQKPVDLLRYLIRTYTNAGETVLDFTMGSGTTGVAALQEGRRFIGVELDPGYFDISRRRIEAVQPALMEIA
jgi:site-specific DNA-methyltransferase (adenine-specific)